jgi:hypothetical protein
MSQNLQNSTARMVKVAAPGKLRELRFLSSLLSRKMTREEARAQMRRNGSVQSPNPYYRGPENEDGS